MSHRPKVSPTVQAREKESALITWLRARGTVLIGFSGGVDSAYLACVAVAAVGRDHVVAAIGLSPAYPDAQWETARRVASQFGVSVVELRTDEMDDPRYAANPINRCYFCKTELWSKLVPLARERGIGTVIDGTNADDARDFRPGARAGAEYGVQSPLRDVGLTKAEIRALSRARGMPTWAQPSSPCLSSRLPHGTLVTVERLRQVERAEAALRALGITGDLRVRHYGDLARVELGPEALSHWAARRQSEAVAAAVRAEGFTRVEIDPRGYRSGSLNVRSVAPLSRD
jgi:pyridinium-3,5-biscarboxylic acid mononucleotide sulfurtransferase